METSTQADTSQKNASEVGGAKKRLATKIVACLLALVMVSGIVLGIVFGIKSKDKNLVDLSNTYISNFSKLDAIGAGCVFGEGENLSAADSGEASKLIGKNRGGYFEELEYSKSSDGKNPKPIPMHILDIASFKNFTAVCFSTKSEASQIGTDSFFSFKTADSVTYSTYLIDNKTGKFYSLKKLFDVAGATKLHFSCDNLYTNTIETDRYLYLSFASNDIGSSGAVTKTYLKIFRLQLSGGELVAEQLFDTKSVSGEYKYYFVDRFDNIILQSEQFDTAEEIKQLVVGQNKSVTSPSTQYRLCINKNAYSLAGTEMLSAGGTEQLLDVPFENRNVYISNKNRVLATEVASYYYSLGSGYIDKVERTDGDNFIKSTIPVAYAEAEAFVATSKYLYFLVNQNLFYVEIETGKSDMVRLDTHYNFSKIEPDGFGNVYFIATGEDQSQVFGALTNMAESKIYQTPPNYKFLFLAPLN